MDKLRLTACGVNCNGCDQYKVTTEQDIKSAKLMVEWFKSQRWIEQNEGNEAVLKKAPLCYGC